MKYAAKRVNDIHAPSFSDLAASKTSYTRRTGQQVIDFSVGSSNIPPCKEVKEAIAKAALADENYQYTLQPSSAVLKAVQDWYAQRYGVELAEEEIFPLKGSQEALSHLPMALLDPGDLMLIPDPCYPIYRTAPLLAGAETYFMPMRKENDYLIDFDEIPEEIAKKAKLMLVSYPSNPTGAVAGDDFYEKLIDFATRNEILIIHDNAYSELIFNGEPGHSFLSYPGAKEIGVELNSFSKSYSMGGARMAVLVGNADLVAPYSKLMNTIDFQSFGPVHAGAIAALTRSGDFVRQVREEYKRRAEFLIDQFARAGWKIDPVKATMFVWAPIPDQYADSSEFMNVLLEKAGVLTNPGTSFGKEGERFVRLALVRSDEEVAEAARRIAQSGLFA
ncbi:aminotransferase class I/II-fold pyridoxal phosphate-dependent enzyme [Erysipelotrichaceae bacterium 51-3]